VGLRRPKRLGTFSYTGRFVYFVTCATPERRKVFTDADGVRVCAEQIVRTCGEREFEVLAYVFMEDHLHLLIRGLTDGSSFKPSMTLIRQRTALVWRRARSERLWQDGYFERVLRPTDDLFSLIRYIRDNPRVAGLPAERADYPFVWSAATINAGADDAGAAVNRRATGVAVRPIDRADDRRPRRAASARERHPRS
jgi:REP element-mobilizing transposase RayT